MKLRGFHSKRSSSTARSTEAIGAAKIADMPAAAPATSSVLRSAEERWKSCAKSDPAAPPVMMIGPSAPNGPPVPIEIADDTGFRTATFASSRLRPIRIASSASGMPWPRIFGEPQRAIAPMIESADDRDQDAPGPRVIARRREPLRRESAAVGEVRDQRDQQVQAARGERPEDRR